MGGGTITNISGEWIKKKNKNTETKKYLKKIMRQCDAEHECVSKSWQQTTLFILL